MQLCSEFTVQLHVDHGITVGDDIRRYPYIFSTHDFVITRTRRMGWGNRGRVVLQITDNGHLSHGEIVLVTNDDDILGYKV